MHELFAGIDHKTGVPLFDDFVLFLNEYAKFVTDLGVTALTPDHPARESLEREYEDFQTLPENVRFLTLFINWMADFRHERALALEAYVERRMSAIPLDAKEFRRGLRVMLRKPFIRREITFLRAAIQFGIFEN